MPSDAQAREIVASQYQAMHKRPATPQAVRAIQLVGRLETRYGLAKPFPGSFNWGAVQLCKPGAKNCAPEGQCPENGFLHEDSYPRPDGSSVKYAVCFRKYTDDNDGARGLISNLTTARQKLWPLLDSGDAWLIAAAMYDSTYYQGFGKTREDRIDGYARAFERNDAEVSAALGGPRLVRYSGKKAPLGAASSGGGGEGFVLLLGLAGLGLALRK